MKNTNQFKYEAELLSRASFPATLEEGGQHCIVEVSVYRLNSVAVTSLMLDGFDPFLLYIGLGDGTDTYITRHELDDLVTVAHIRKEDDAWQH